MADTCTDIDGNTIEVGSRVEIIHMDDPHYQFLVGQTGTVTSCAEGANNSAQVDLDTDLIPYISTQAAWLRRLAE